MITEYSSEATCWCPACLASCVLTACLDGLGWGHSSWGGPCIQLAFALLGLNWLLWNTCHRATVTPGLGAVAPPIERWALRSWILIPYHGTGVQVGPHVRRSQMPCALLQPPPHLQTHRKGLSRAWPDCSNRGPSLCPLGLSSRPCKTLGMSCTGVHQVGWGLTTRVMA